MPMLRATLMPLLVSVFVIGDGDGGVGDGIGDISSYRCRYCGIGINICRFDLILF